MKEIVRKVCACIVIYAMLVPVTALSMKILEWMFKVDIGNLWQRSFKLALVALVVVAVIEWRRKKKQTK